MKVVLERLYPDPPRPSLHVLFIGLLLGFLITRYWVL